LAIQAKLALCLGCAGSRRTGITFSSTGNITAFAIIRANIRGAFARVTAGSAKGRTDSRITFAAETDTVAAVTALPFIGGLQAIADRV
jgi:hypothetical protein